MWSYVKDFAVLMIYEGDTWWMVALFKGAGSPTHMNAPNS